MIAVLLSAAACQLGGGGAFVLPDPVCSPGKVAHVATKAEACTPALHPRDPVSASLRRQVIASYGLDPATFHGELDHVEPVFLLGESVPANLFPEPGDIPNQKDKLERRAFDRVCRG